MGEGCWQYQVQYRNPHADPGRWDHDWNFCNSRKVDKDTWYPTLYGARYLRAREQRAYDFREYRIVRRSYAPLFEVVE